MRVEGDATRRATCQLVSVSDEGPEVVVDLVHLGGDQLDAIGPARQGDTMTVGLVADPGVPEGQLEDLRETLHAWNDGDGVCELFVVPIDSGRRLVLVHDDQVIVIDSS